MYARFDASQRGKEMPNFSRDQKASSLKERGDKFQPGDPESKEGGGELCRAKITWDDN